MLTARGQTAADAVGALLVVSVIIAALSTTTAGARIASETSRIVCEIAGGECEAVPEAEAEPVSSSSGPEGPALGNRPLTVLPFPGYVSVTCTVELRRQRPQNCTPDKAVSVNATGEIRLERTPTTLDPNGCPSQTASVSTSLTLSVNGNAENKKAGGSLSGYLGAATNYGITTAPDEMDAIADGRREAPNPVDPRTLRQGESVELSEEFYAGIGASGSYRNIQVEMGYDSGRRVSSGVQRVSATTVRVLVGDEDFVRSALKVGVDADVVSLALGSVTEVSDGKLHAIEIDISTESGWNTYQAFLKSGRLPGDSADGASNPTRSETVSVSDVSQLEAKFGPITIGGRVGSSEGRLTETRNADGTVDSVVYSRFNDTALAITHHLDAQGNPAGPSTYSLLLHGLDPSYIPSLYERTGRRPPANPGTDVRLDFTEEQLNQLWLWGLEKLRDRAARAQGGNPTIEDIARSLRENDGVVKWNGGAFSAGGLESLLGQALTPDEMLWALYDRGHLGPEAAIESLLSLLTGKSLALPATVVTPSC